MTELTPFEFPDSGQRVRTVMIDGAPWFAAADICAILAIGNASQAISYLDDDERQSLDVSAGQGTLTSNEGRPTSGNPVLNLVSEPGLYSLILRSRKPEAKRFKRWVTHELLPTLRTTGTYTMAELSRRELARHWYEAETRAELAEEKIGELAPKAEQADQHRAADGCMAIADFANKVKAWARQKHGVKVLHQEVWDFLGEINLIIRGNTIRHNQRTAFATERDFVRMKETEYDTGTRGQQTSASPRLTPAGEGWAWDRVVRRVEKTGTLRRSESGAA